MFNHRKIQSFKNHLSYLFEECVGLVDRFRGANAYNNMSITYKKLEKYQEADEILKKANEIKNNK
ncbi:hypothetical protein MNB_SUP05-5-510 [hydrothermal vent metagenome]|uniref:Uncharacterized protein n=1 Tax=hydrothermal vent metagenome TaxID=652676 RepID=A0A1W1CSE7_9ZZZZ